jgi:hypothetical protein
VNPKRGVLIEEMERLLKIWLDDQTQKRIPERQAIISAKAKSLYDELKKRIGESVTDETYSANHGWFDRFKRRANLQNLKLSGEAASAENDAASTYPAQLDQLTYCAHQDFNVDETGLFWKKVPARTLFAKEEKTAQGYKSAKDRLTLLLGGNAAGYFKIKPLLVHHSENPRAFNGKVKTLLPIIWR